MVTDFDEAVCTGNTWPLSCDEEDPEDPLTIGIRASADALKQPSLKKKERKKGERINNCQVMAVIIITRPVPGKPALHCPQKIKEYTLFRKENGMD